MLNWRGAYRSDFSTASSWSLPRSPKLSAHSWRSLPTGWVRPSWLVWGSPEQGPARSRRMRAMRWPASPPSATVRRSATRRRQHEVTSRAKICGGDCQPCSKQQCDSALRELKRRGGRYLKWRSDSKLGLAACPSAISGTLRPGEKRKRMRRPAAAWEVIRAPGSRRAL